MIDNVEFVPIESAKEIVKKFHYSKVFPRINKFAIGGFIQNKLVAVMLCGYGTRPLHTIKKIFPTLCVKDYIELGKLCVDDECPKNTESYFISRCIKLIKSTYPQYKIFFSWADGIVGKPGYVYQCSNFYYGGFITTEMYLDKNGNRVHPRSIQGISTGEKAEGTKFKSRSYDVTMGMGYKKYFGLQFRYVYPLCNQKEWKELLKTTPFEWSKGNYPKDNDCVWKEQVTKGKRIDCEKPPFNTTKYVEKKNGNISLFFNVTK